MFSNNLICRHVWHVKTNIFSGWFHDLKIKYLNTNFDWLHNLWRFTVLYTICAFGLTTSNVSWHTNKSTEGFYIAQNISSSVTFIVVWICAVNVTPGLCGIGASFIGLSETQHIVLSCRYCVIHQRWSILR